MPFFSFVLNSKCCKGSKASKRITAVELDELPPARLVSVETIPLRVTSYLPISPRPIPKLDVSASSSTSVAMFEHLSTTSMNTLTNSFTTHDTFVDGDLASPTVFPDPPKQRKTSPSPFDDQHEVNNTLAASSSLSKNTDDDKDFHASSSGSAAPLALSKQSGRVTSRFGDEHGLESEPEIEYAPTTPSPIYHYTERAMEYQRVSLLFGPDSPESYNLQRDHTLALLEGTKPQPTTPLDPELVEILAPKMGRRQQELDY